MSKTLREIDVATKADSDRYTLRCSRELWALVGDAAVANGMSRNRLIRLSLVRMVEEIRQQQVSSPCDRVA